MESNQPYINEPSKIGLSPIIHHLNESNKKITSKTDDNFIFEKPDFGSMLSSEEEDDELGRQLKSTPFGETKTSNLLRNMSNLDNDIRKVRNKCIKTASHTTTDIKCNRKHSVFMTMVTIFCGLSYRAALLIIGVSFWIIFTTMSVLKQFCQVDNFLKVPFYLPKAIIERLYCFSNLNTCRQIGVGSLLSLPTSKRCPQNQNILTKCTWPMWILFGVIMFTSYLSCKYSTPNTPIVKKVFIGIEHLGKFSLTFHDNLYNMPGHNCMINNNCCQNKYIATVRWLYCLITLPYRVSFMGMEKGQSNIAVIEELLENLTDWRIKRNFHKIRSSLQDAKHVVARTQLKNDQFDKSISKLEVEGGRNLSTVDILAYTSEKDERLYEDNIKMFEDNLNHINLLQTIKANIMKVAKEAIKCIRCSVRKGEYEAEKYIGMELVHLGKMLRKSRKLIKFVEELNKLTLEAVLKPFREEVEKLTNDLFPLNFDVEQLESFYNKFEIDVNVLKENTFNNLRTEMLRFKQKNEEFMIKYTNTVNGLSTNIKRLDDEQRSNIPHLAAELLGVYITNMKKCMVEMFLKQIKDVIRLTVGGTMKLIMSCKPKRKAGLFGGPSNSSECQKKKLVDKHVCVPIDICPSRDMIKARINTILRIFSSDQSGLVDFALWGNGGRVIDRLTEPDPLHIPIDLFSKKDTGLSLFWKQLISGVEMNPSLVNSVFFLNHGNVVPGLCWLFIGSKGTVVINLSQPIMIKMITINHIDPAISHIQNYSDALKEFEVKVLKDLTENGNEISLGKFVFQDIAKYPNQQFDIENPIKTNLVKFIIHSNHGAEVTCVHRIRVHGDPINL